MTAPVLAWHFVGATLRDGLPVPPDGVKLLHNGPLRLRASGFHASLHPFDALTHAPGATLCRVKCGGEIIHGNDKLVCRERMIIKRIDATDLLRRFARICALDVIDLWDAPDVVRQYLETGDESIRATARAAAKDAAWAAAGDAARAAAGGVPALAAARAAAKDAAWAAQVEDWAAARYAQRERFASMVEEAFA